LKSYVFGISFSVTSCSPLGCAFAVYSALGTYLKKALLFRARTKEKGFRGTTLIPLIAALKGCNGPTRSGLLDVLFSLLALERLRRGSQWRASSLWPSLLYLIIEANFACFTLTTLHHSRLLYL
jgi:hypothetical protein